MTTISNRPTAPEAAFRYDIKRYPSRPVIISEGDSWFANPLRDNLMVQISRMGRFSLLRLEKSGDEIVNILSSKQKRKLRRLLSRYPVPLLLISGGGNDIVGPELLPLLKDRTSVNSWQEAIHKTRFKRRMQQIKNAYLDLIDLRDDCRADCTIMTHGYDYPIPSDKGAELGPIKISGPWMKPYMEEKNIVLRSEQKKIARWLITEFNVMLKGLADNTNDFVYVKTPGTLVENDWGDEIHPKSRGFKKISRKFVPHLRALFPGRAIG